MTLKRALAFLAGLTATAALGLTTSCGGGGGDLTIYAGRSQQLVQPLLEQFSKDTGIKIRVRYGDGTDLALGILEEGNNSPADVYYGQDVGALGALKAENRLAVLPRDVLDKVQSAADVQATMDSSNRWVTLAFTWNGLRALGVPEESLATFPDAFREGMSARANILGDTGSAAPEHWVGGLAGDDLHAIAILFSRTDEQGHPIVCYQSTCGPVVEKNALALLRHNTRMVHGAFAVASVGGQEMIVVQANQLVEGLHPLDVTRLLSAVAWQADKVEEKLLAGEDQN